MTVNPRYAVALICLGMGVASVGAAQAQELNLYSSRHYETDEALYAEFQEQTGIKINRIEGEADELIERINAEGARSPADILITVDAGRLWRADQNDLFQPVSSPLLDERIPAELRHPDGHWFGFSQRARVIVHNPEIVDGSLIASYQDLTKPELEGQVCIRSSTNIYNLSLMASLIEHLGEEEALAWAEGVVANFARDPEGNDTAQIKAVAAGECGITLVNSYYVARLMNSDDPTDQEVADAVEVIFPNQDGRGTHVNISGAGVLANAPNRDAAVQFLEYLAQDQAQLYFANGNNEYPVVEAVDPENEALASLGEFKADTLNVAVLGQNQADAQRLFDKAGWR